jgi:hypothetical protein
MIAFLAFPVLAQDGTGPMPENAEARNYGGGWNCALGYRVAGEECVAIDIPENAYATGRSYGSGWACRRGYEEAGGTSCERSRCPRMRSCDPPAMTGSAIADTGRIARPAFQSSCLTTPISPTTPQAPVGPANAVSRPVPAPAFRLRFPRTAISPMRTTVTNGPAKGASSKSMAVAIPWRFPRTPFWTRRPTGRDGAVSGDLRPSTPPVSRSTFRQTRISIDPETRWRCDRGFQLADGECVLGR